MHTSRKLASHDFGYQQIDQSGYRQADFGFFCSDYHPRDRIGVVCPVLEDGVEHCASALLAFTTRFYDCLRKTGEPFFDYPQHFCILDVNDQGINTRTGRRLMDVETYSAAWTQLDVWPSAKWFTTDAGIPGMLQKVMDLQLNRIFWPGGYFHPPTADQPLLPWYVRKILRTHLKQVLVYDTTSPDIRVLTSANGVIEADNAINRLNPFTPTVPPLDGSQWKRANGFRRLDVAEFMNGFTDYFEAD